MTYTCVISASCQDQKFYIVLVAISPVFKFPILLLNISSVFKFYIELVDISQYSIRIPFILLTVSVVDLIIISHALALYLPTSASF